MMSGMLALPEECIAAAISFTSPRDACRLACVSTTFKSAADSDAVWDRFLPPEYLSAISNPVPVSGSSSSTWSKKELYLRMGPTLIQNGKLSFWFDRSSGKKCYMISARELTIIRASGDTPWSWGWINDFPGARFPKVAKLKNVYQFEIHGKINTSLLSTMTTYISYLVFKPTDNFGLAGGNVQNRTVYFDQRQQNFVSRDNPGLFPKERGDGWLESEFGEFFHGSDEEGELSMAILEINPGNVKYDLVVQGIEIRPKKVK
ncbi:hypothetical protein Ddye_022637 [Dipteronia dyeriana]|uniref:F-box domain-containing protein n=1 Tax=Dipteronia dyeriana TaxID=168575 RepID=A0AAD9WRD7_9ROSI|nr:hypothetical protein Ddye_022637 [Dipteronia dyeriana]